MKKTQIKEVDLLTDEPFPLKNQFQRFALPAMVAIAAIIIALSFFSPLNAMMEVYLKIAQDRAATIVHSGIKQHPEAWKRFVNGQLNSDNIEELKKLFEREVRELKLDKFKVYTETGRTLYSTNPEEIGKYETSLIFKLVVATGEPEINAIDRNNDGEVLEIYLPYRHVADGPLLVFELYDSSNHLDNIIIRNSVFPALAPMALFAFLIFLSWVQIGKAQNEIDARTNAVSSLRHRLEALVSKSAVLALKEDGKETSIPSEKVYCTLFYSDICDFTGYSEQNSPEKVVNFLNDIMGLQIEILNRYGGDVDKMIGDALLVRFDGAASHKAAVDAAREIQQEIARTDFPRKLSVGVYSGLVVSGVVGPVDRRDFTVIGDSVNAAARLCSAAQEGEVIIDTETATHAGTEWEETETIQVKGRKLPLTVVRLKP